MTTIRSSVPGHDDGTAFVRLRRGNWPMTRQARGCRTTRARARMRSSARDVATNRARDWSEISGELRRIRGMYGTKKGAEAALMDHIGMQTR